MPPSTDQDLFEMAYEKLIAELPKSLAQVLERLRARDMKWVRVSSGVLLLLGGSMAFLPILGLELLPLGLLLLAQDVHFLRAPTAKLLLWLLERWHGLKQQSRRLWAAVL